MPLLLAIGACLATGLAATWFLLARRLPRARRAAGRALLAGMDNDEFMHLVLAVLNGRGFERTFGGGGAEGEYLVERHGRGWLLSSRYSHAYTPDSTAIAEFSSYLRHRGVPGGVLAITGRFPRAAFAVARAHRIELLDSDNMWEELQPLFDDAQHAAIDRPARARLRPLFALAWIVALAIGAGAFALGQRAESRVEAMAANAMGAHDGEAAPAAELPAPDDAGAASATTTPTPDIAPAAPTAPVAGTAAAGEAAAAALADRRHAITEAALRLPHVRSANWPAPSTLQVVVDDETFDPRARLCPLLEDDPDLGTTRLQVQYPTSQQRPVRFLQCRMF